MESLLDHRVGTATAGDLLDQDEGELLPRAERQLTVRGEEVDQVAERDCTRSQPIVQRHRAAVSRLRSGGSRAARKRGN